MNRSETCSEGLLSWSREKVEVRPTAHVYIQIESQQSTAKIDATKLTYPMHSNEAREVDGKSRCRKMDVTQLPDDQTMLTVVETLLMMQLLGFFI